MSDIDTEQLLIESVKAYAKKFETLNSREEVLAIANSILTFQQKQGTIAIAPEQFETLSQQVADRFKVEDVATSIVESSTDALVQNVNQWRQTLENQVLNTLSAYVQKFQPNQNLDLPETILSIIPMVENAQLRKSEVNSLIQRVSSKFDWQNALTQVIGSDASAIAQNLAKLLQYKHLEDLLKENLFSDRNLLNQPIESTAESLVNNELAKILGDRKVKFDIDIDTQQLIVKQVTFKLNMMQSSAAPSKSNAEIAKQLDDETNNFMASRKPKLDFGNLFQPPN
ncbi:MAG: hypothetical protein DCF19_06255 [Pseudanabaena frigida]|uniref:Uncharacterized protein n=1 Tax=Pseudanabaena frigida TaxID=945775 RepID=A0A2W4WL69_9CYAN|nr:MAG: hypothetical protein DCF19_06255 [Pseudanabaena frigida]